MDTPLSYWIGFNAAVVILFVLDLVILHKETHAPSMRESILTTLGFIGLAVGFGVWLTWQMGSETGSQFFTGYVIEYSLSMDNLFLFVLIFTNFRVGADQQRRLLFWGVIGALVMRGILIAAGSALLQRFEWIIYLFGAYIVYAGFNMLFQQHKVEVESMTVVRLSRRFLPISSGDHHGHFIVRENGKVKFTLLFLVLIVVELTDLIFALDSIPAIFGITRHAYVVWTSNVCAVMGLRSLYFVLAGAVKSLVYLHHGLAFVLIFIGGKMVVEHYLPISTVWSLVIVGGILGASVIASLFKMKMKPPSSDPSSASGR